MKILAIDTATSHLSVALLDGDAVLAHTHEEAALSHARLLIRAVDRVLASGGLTLANLHGLAVSIGPGSFTGLRVGLSTMLGFRTVTGLPLAAVPTLEALAWNVRRPAIAVCPVIHARAGEVYWARYRWDADGQLHCVQPECVGPLERLAEALEGPTLMVGEGWERHRDAVRRLLGSRNEEIVDAPLHAMAVSAVSVGLVGRRLLERGENAPIGLAPRYVQRAEAELNWERRTAGSVPEPLRWTRRQDAARARRAQGSRRRAG